MNDHDKAEDEPVYHQRVSVALAARLLGENHLVNKLESATPFSLYWRSCLLMETKDNGQGSLQLNVASTDATAWHAVWVDVSFGFIPLATTTISTCFGAMLVKSNPNGGNLSYCYLKSLPMTMASLYKHFESAGIDPNNAPERVGASMGRALEELSTGIVARRDNGDNKTSSVQDGATFIPIYYSDHEELGLLEVTGALCSRPDQVMMELYLKQEELVQTREATSNAGDSNAVEQAFETWWSAAKSTNTNADDETEVGDGTSVEQATATTKRTEKKKPKVPPKKGRPGTMYRRGPRRPPPKLQYKALP